MRCPMTPAPEECPMIATAALTMNFGKKILFENVSVKFLTGNCYGLIGKH